MERGGAYTLIGRLKLTTETKRKRTSAGGAWVSDGRAGACSCRRSRYYAF
jgi:hypothetical protein